MAKKYDIVVMGGGQNTLGAAAYLAKAGKKIAVLERHSFVGGGAVTLERTLPGFLHDKHSALHILIQANPLIQNDELGLLSRFGLQYIYPDVATVTILEDFTALPFHYDLDKTCEAIAKFSQKDAEAYRELALFARRMLPMVLAGMFNVPIPMSGLLALLEQSPDGRRMIGYMLRSPRQIVEELFESDHVRIHMIKSCSEHALVFPDDMGTGLALLFLTVFLHIYKLGLPMGGSGALSEALKRCIEHHGGDVIRDCEVVEVITSGSRATGLRTATGEEYLANDAVIAAIHPKKLRQFVEGVPEAVLESADRTQHSGYRLFKVDAALKQPLQKNVPDNISTNALVDWVFAHDYRDFLKSFDPLRHGEVSLEKPLIGGSDLQPPGRVPNDTNALLYFISYQPWDLADGGPAKWDEIKDEVADKLFERCTYFMPNLTPDNIMARVVDSPLDMERYSPNSMVQGDVMGVGFQFFHTAGYRPTPELAQFAVPGIERLYICGPFMHPGGGIFGVGRPTAMKVCDDLGIDFDKVIG